MFLPAPTIVCASAILDIHVVILAIGRQEFQQTLKDTAKGSNNLKIT